MDDEIAGEAQLPLETAGAKLRRAREAAGLSRADIAARTKIAERHLQTVEDSNYSALASITYAVGFARAYARTVGLNKSEIAQEVRGELALREEQDDRRAAMNFDPGDPARVPASRLALIAGLAALLVIAAVFFWWRSFATPAVSLPDLTAPETSAPAAEGTQPGASAAAQGPVVFTALQQGVWVKFYDAAGTQLMQKEMALGETYTVPAQANGPMIWTARPDALQITIGGRQVPPLADAQVTLKDVPVTAAALLARQNAGAAPVANPPLAPALAPAPAPAPVAAEPRQRATPTPQPRAKASSMPTSTPAPAPAPAATPVQPVSAAPAPVQTSTVSE